jgi:hypothetical protein
MDLSYEARPFDFETRVPLLCRCLASPGEGEAPPLLNRGILGKTLPSGEKRLPPRLALSLPQCGRCAETCSPLCRQDCRAVQAGRGKRYRLGGVRVTGWEG